MLMRHKSRSHYAIFVKPAMDGFILSQVTLAGLNLVDYGLPSDLKAFTRVTKTITTQTDPRFKKLFNDLKGCREIVIFRQALNHLKENRFTSSDEELKRIFCQE